MNSDSRPSWDEYFIEITKLTSKRSNCYRKKVGCVIVKNHRIISSGYNGTPSNLLNCCDGGCERCLHRDLYKSGEKLDLCLCLHAEENALLFANFSDLIDSTLYCTHFPCISCSKKIIQCQIKNIVYLHNYNEEMEKITTELFDKVGINVVKYSET